MSVDQKRPQPNVPSVERARVVVLVTIDGVRWEDLFIGATAPPLDHPFALMPKTKALVDERGVALGGGGDGCGVVRPANGAYLSLPGYTEILTGRPTACTDNECPGVFRRTIVDDAALDSVARSLGPVASISSWEKLARAATNGTSPALVSAGRGTWPEASTIDPSLRREVALGDRADPAPGGELYRPDERTAAIALAYLRAERPRFLHVGLGDTDEHGHAGDYPAYMISLRIADLFVADLARTLDKIAVQSTVVVTTDHGRATDFREHGATIPESGRSFVLAFGDGIAHRGVVCHHRDATLPDVGATLRELLDLDTGSSDGGTPVGEMLATHGV